MSGRTAQLVRFNANERKDNEERLTALRLQVRAWRALTMVALAEPESAAATAQWLMFNTVPFVNGPALERFVAEYEAKAEECGIKAGVFGKPAGRAALASHGREGE